MPMIENPERLRNCLRILNNHYQEITDFYKMSIGLRVNPDMELEEKLIQIFKASVSERRGASRKRGEDAIEEFERKIPILLPQIQELLPNNPENAHQKLFENLCEIPNVDQKIAAMCLKFVVVIFEELPNLKNYLYVPLDSVVLRMLGETTLQIAPNLPWTQSPRIKNAGGHLYWVRGDHRPVKEYSRFLDLQREFKDIADGIHVKRILIDELWFIGQIFCKEYPLCEVCWFAGEPVNCPSSSFH